MLSPTTYSGVVALNEIEPVRIEHLPPAPHHVDRATVTGTFTTELSQSIGDAPGYEIETGDDLTLTGWALLPSATAAESLSIFVGDRQISGVRYGLPRPDVATSVADAEAIASGFTVTIPGDAFAAGDNSIAAVLESDGTAIARAELATVRTRPARPREGEPTFSIDAVTSDLAPKAPSDFWRGTIVAVSGRVVAAPRAPDVVSIAGVLDRGSLTPALGERGRANGRPEYRFTWRFDSRHLAAGTHTFALVALSHEGECLGATAQFSFTIASNVGRFPHAESHALVAPAELEIVERKTVDGDELVFVRGWAIDPVENDAAGDVVLAIDATHYVRTKCRQWRGDVAARLGFPKAENCGFVATIRTALLGTGTHSVTPIVLSKDERRVHTTTARLEL